MKQTKIKGWAVLGSDGNIALHGGGSRRDPMAVFYTREDVKKEIGKVAGDWRIIKVLITLLPPKPKSRKNKIKR